MTIAAPVAAPPTASAGIRQFLRNHIRPREGCEKCEAARGPDASVRLLFAAEGGRCGHNRDVSLKRACPLAEHAISAQDGVSLLKQYEHNNGMKLPNKKQKVCDFMQSEYGVERLGKPPSFQVSLYSAPRVAAHVSVSHPDANPVKLDLTAIGHKPVAKKGTCDHFMGFEMV